MEYYLRCIEYPKFANPELSKLDYKNQTLDGNKEKFFDYQWFVSFMLLACDEVIRLRGGAEWERFAENNVSYHRGYIKSPAFVESYHLFGPQLRGKIHQMREEKQTTEGPKKDPRYNEAPPLTYFTLYGVKLPLFAFGSDHAARNRGVCTENLTPDVVVMKSAKDRV